MESVGGSYSPPQTLQIEQFIGHQVELTLGARVTGSGNDTDLGVMVSANQKASPTKKATPNFAK